MGGLKTSSMLAMAAVGQRGHNVVTARANMLPGRANGALRGWILMRKAGILRLMEELKKAPIRAKVGESQGRERTATGLHRELPM